MKTDDQVLEEATGIVESQWCQSAWYSPATQQYCAVGAIEKAVGTHLGGYDTLKDHEPDGEKIAQVARVARRVWGIIEDQYPDEKGVERAPEVLKAYGLDYVTTWALENFNDVHTREEMLAIFEKARHG